MTVRLLPGSRAWPSGCATSAGAAEPTRRSCGSTVTGRRSPPPNVPARERKGNGPKAVPFHVRTPGSVGASIVVRAGRISDKLGEECALAGGTVALPARAREIPLAFGLDG